MHIQSGMVELIGKTDVCSNPAVISKGHRLNVCCSHIHPNHICVFKTHFVTSVLIYNFIMRIISISIKPGISYIKRKNRKFPPFPLKAEIFCLFSPGLFHKLWTETKFQQNPEVLK